MIESDQVAAGLSVAELVLGVLPTEPKVDSEAPLLADLAAVFCSGGHTGRATGLVQQSLTTARLSGRHAVFTILRVQIGTMACLGGHQLLAGIANAILDVEQWWDDPDLVPARTPPLSDADSDNPTRQEARYRPTDGSSTRWNVSG
jgi:hypothetical protein